VTAIPLRRIEGKYEILEKLGEGGMGAVYKVRHRLLDELRVIKVMRPQFLQEEELKARFLREARVAIRLRHPGIAQLYDFSLDDDDVAFIVMEFIQGITLEELLRQGPPPPLALTLEIAQQALRALHYLHGRGFVHRDVSPDNLMLGEGQDGEPLVKLIDLGIAKRLDDGAGAPLTLEGTFLGKLRYASPEQFGEAGASAVGVRGDLYSFSVVLYELLTGRHPIRGNDPTSLMASHLFEPPIAFAESDADGRIPEPLRALVLQALAKNPEERFATALELERALAAFRTPSDLDWLDLSAFLCSPDLQDTAPPPPPRVRPGSTQDRLDQQFELSATPVPTPARGTEVIREALREEIPEAEPKEAEPDKAGPNEAEPYEAGPYEVEAAPARTLRFPVPPPPLPPVSAAAERTLPPAAARPAGRRHRVHLLTGVSLLLALIAIIAGLVAWTSQRIEPAPQAQIQPPPPPKPAPRPALVAPLAPAPVHPQILLAQEALGKSDLTAAQDALAEILPEQIALFTSEEQDLYQQAVDASKLLHGQQWAATLARGLRSGDLRLLRTAATSPPDAAALTPEQRKDLARANESLALNSKLVKAERDQDHPGVLLQASLLLAQLPRNSRALHARKGAADALLAEADARTGRAELDAARAALEHLRNGWPDHSGIAGRLERLQSERRIEDQMEEALAAMARAQRTARPLDGLRVLDRVQPNERYAERFRQARELLQAQLAELDRNQPQIAMAGSSEMAYEKGAVVKIPLRITDDHGAKSATAWARPEGGRFKSVPVRALGGAEYEIEILPDLHQNRNIDFYVEASDHSGHRGGLGSAPQPRKIKRKRWRLLR
jgi:serine/threonine-protein kinase